MLFNWFSCKLLINMAKIKNINARQILDSRGNPTVEADVYLDNGSNEIVGRASVPSGASTGLYEAVEVRDGGEDFSGKGVTVAVKNIEEKIKPSIVGMDAKEQRKIDSKMIEMDGTGNKSKLGANAILAVSMACSVAQSKIEGIELYDYIGKNFYDGGNKDAYDMPTFMVNIVNGGAHADFSTDFQEYMVIPSTNLDFNHRINACAKIFHTLKKILKEKDMITLVGDEGGFAPGFKSNFEPMDYILIAIEKAGYRPGEDVSIGLDVASSEFYNKDEKTYNLHSENKILNTDELISYYGEMLKKYPVTSIEDGLEQEDFEGWTQLTTAYGDTIQIVGDDFYVTNVNRLKKGIEMKSSNAILIKLNQIGTVTETIDAINLAKANNMNSVVSHRSGETEDTFIADLAVGMRTGQIKTGSFSRSERLAKYNQLIRIAETV